MGVCSLAGEADCGDIATAFLLRSLEMLSRSSFAPHVLQLRQLGLFGGKGSDACDAPCGAHQMIGQESVTSNANRKAANDLVPSGTGINCSISHCRLREGKLASGCVPVLVSL